MTKEMRTCSGCEYEYEMCDNVATITRVFGGDGTYRETTVTTIACSPQSKYRLELGVCPRCFLNGHPGAYECCPCCLTPAGEQWANKCTRPSDCDEEQFLPDDMDGEEPVDELLDVEWFPEY